jgi:hypothetical protein
MAGMTTDDDERLCNMCGVLQVDVEDGYTVTDEYGIAHFPNEYGTAECGLLPPEDGWRE